MEEVLPKGYEYGWKYDMIPMLPFLDSVLALSTINLSSPPVFLHAMSLIHFVDVISDHQEGSVWFISPSAYFRVSQLVSNS